MEILFFFLSQGVSKYDANTMLVQQPTIAVSACLLGQPVRYDGQEKSQPLIIDFFVHRHSDRIKLVPFCPEVGAGLGVPRAKIQLVQQKGQPIRVLGVKNHTLDVTDAIQSYAREFLQQHPEVCFFIVKSRSPSCGHRSTPLFADTRPVDVLELTSGLFVQTLLGLKPQVKIVEETQFITEQDCQQFLQQVVS